MDTLLAKKVGSLPVQLTVIEKTMNVNDRSINVFMTRFPESWVFAGSMRVHCGGHRCYLMIIRVSPKIYLMRAVTRKGY